MFSIATAPFNTPTTTAQGFQFLHIFTNTCFLFLIVSIVMDVRWYFTVVFFFFSFFFFKEIHFLLFIYLFIYDCVESSFLCEGFL